MGANDLPDGGDNREPTMEEILASIRRIIAEDDEQARTDAGAPETASADLLPELLDENGQPFSASESELLELAQLRSGEARAAIERIISEDTEELAAAKVSKLSSMLVRNYEGSADTLEGLVREILTPMLKTWLDANLPEMVERMVAREIERITRK
jgi:cell pole-organizing protein PopZ